MSKIAIIGVGAALLLGLLFAIIVVGSALLSGSQADVGYAPYEDVGTDSIDSGYDDYEVEDTYMELVAPVIVNDGGYTPPIPSFRS